MRVQHQTRRRGLSDDLGVVLVGESRYELDADGVVDVSAEHAEALLLGAGWARVPEATPAPAPTARPVQAQAADPEREELIKRAAALGVQVDRRLANSKISAAIKAAEERRKP